MFTLTWLHRAGQLANTKKDSTVNHGCKLTILGQNLPTSMNFASVSMCMSILEVYAEVTLDYL